MVRAPSVICIAARPAVHPVTEAHANEHTTSRTAGILVIAASPELKVMSGTFRPQPVSGHDVGAHEDT